MAAVPLVDQVAHLPLTMPVLLVGQVAHLLVEFVVASLACGWEATWSVLRGLYLPFGQPLSLYIRRWQHMISNLLYDRHDARSGGEEGSPTWTLGSCLRPQMWVRKS